MGNSKLTENGLTIASARYFFEEVDKDWEDVSNRVANEIVRPENGNISLYRDRFSEMIYNMDFLPGGRILRNAGRQRGSLFNCYVVPIGDSIEEIGQFVKDSLTLWSEGGGIGTNLSFLRPRGALIKGKGGNSSGPISFLEASDAVAATIESGGARRAAGLACMNASHPDILEFIDAKIVHGKIPHFNISVLVDEDFLDAVESNSKWNFKFAAQAYGSVSAREIWDKIINNMVKDAEPGLLNWDNLRSNNSYYYDPVISCNPCGEAILSPYDVCDLGSLVLPSFITGTINTNWKKLEETIKLAVRFLDNVIEVNKYILKQNEIKAHNSRRIGIGVMGLAEYLFAKKLKYGSNKAIYEIERLMRFIRDVAYQASIELAVEKGAFPKFDSTAYGKAHFVRSLPASLRMDIKDNGIRNVTTLACAPTGCLIGDTLISSNKGCIEIEDYCNINTTHPTELSSDFGNSHFKKFFDQGVADTIKITTDKGYNIEGTYNHKVRVITDGNGYIWKELKNINSNDYVVLKKDFLFEKDTWLRNDVAELLGFYMADGWWTIDGKHSRRLYFKVHEKEQGYVVNLLNKCFADTFKINPIVRDGEGKSKRIEVNSKKLYNWFDKYNCIKKGASNAFIPDIIMTSSKTAILSFIKGFFLGDGGFNTSKENIKFTTVSEMLAFQLHLMLLGIGCVSTKRLEKTKGNTSKYNGRIITSNYNIYRIELSTYYSRFLCELMHIDASVINTKSPGRNFESVLVFPHEEQLFNEVQKIDNREIYYTTKHNYEKNVNITNWFGDNDLIIDKINLVERHNGKHVFDVEVNEVTHTYVANGFVTHNTISLLPEVTSGIEPLFMKSYMRSDRVGKRMYIHPFYKQLLDTNEKIPDWFIDTTDLKPADHFETQVAVQKFVDGAVSKCVSKDTRISFSDGLNKIKDISDNREVDTFSNMDNSDVLTEGGICKVNSLYYNGTVEDGVSFETTNGFSLSGTKQHRIKCLTKDHVLEWKLLGDIVEGDIAVVRLDTNIVDSSKTRSISILLNKEFEFNSISRKKVILPKKVSNDLCWWLGCMFADGSTTFSSNTLSFCQVEGPVLDKFVRISKELFDIDFKLVKDNRRFNLYNAVTSSIVLYDWLSNYINFSKHTIPELIFKVGKIMQRRFIEGTTLDGFISDKHICIKTDKNKSVTSDLQLLCANIGIPTYINSAFNKEYKRNYYNLFVNGDGISTMKSFVFPEKHKQSLLVGLITSNKHYRRKSFMYSKDLVPVNTDFIEGIKILERKLINSNRLYNIVHSIRNQIRTAGGLTLDSILTIYSLFDSDLPITFDSNLLFVKVCKINICELETMDIAVEKEHNYIANGFISHNTINMPKNTTPKQLSRLTLEYIHDLKGVTVYVDGSREGQILNSVQLKDVKEYLKNNKNITEIADAESVRCVTGTCEI